MKFLKKVFFASAVAMLFSSQANAGFLFDISSVALTPGSGIGADANEGLGTSLGIVTSPSGAPAPVELTAAGDFYDFTAGSIQFSSKETAINANETDNVGYTVTLTFASPLIGAVDLDLVGTAFTGGVGDPSPDYTLVLASPVHVFFGNGGEFEISVGKLALTKGGAAGAKDLNVTITLIHAPIVPEPSSMALLGLGGLGIAFARYRKRFNKSAV